MILTRRDIHLPRITEGRLEESMVVWSAVLPRMRIPAKACEPVGWPALNSLVSSRMVSLARWVASAMVAVVVMITAPSAKAQNFTCSPPAPNQIVCENSLAGNPPSDWQISGSGDSTIQGFATDISVNQGQTISFKIKTDARAYTISIFRLGFYGGLGARRIVGVNPSAALPQTQPACLTNGASKLYDCGNWAVSASWSVPANATSGLYMALLRRSDTGGTSQIFFVVRNDSSHSDVLYQTADETWQAYNNYGGHSLYGDTGFNLPNRAFKVSYNRPSNTSNFETATWLFSAEYPMIRWLEANGYDLSYFTHVDGVRSPALYLNHKILLTAGHDEYWSGPLRTNVEAARDGGINMAFFSGNEVFWKTRWENSIDGTNTPYRTLVCYKETLDNADTDPADPPTWTGTWRDPRFSPPADGGKPENSLNGTIFLVNGPGSDNTGLSIKVPAADGKMRFWRNTAYANQTGSQVATLPSGTLGYEWDSELDNGARPAGLFWLSSATYNLTTDLLLDFGGVYGAGSATHHLTMYRAPSGALVFGAGTVQWSWGLDANHDASTSPAPNPDPNMQQATVNLLADMGVQPASLQPGLSIASKSTDTTAPTSMISSPVSGSTQQIGVALTVQGTAVDVGGGGVAAVELSVDGGQTWHPATGRANWSYSWTPLAGGTYNIKSRAVDDSGNLETPTPGITVTVPKPPVNIDANTSADSPAPSTTINSPSFSTTQGGELLMAFIATDYLGGTNTTVTGVSGGGLTWALVVRANARNGTSEIWRALAPSQLSNVTVTATLSQSTVSSITVLSFTGVDTSGTNGSGAIGATKAASSASGAPSATVVSTRASSWVFGVGNDFDNAIGRTPGSNQSLLHQYLTPTGDTYWVQMQNTPAPSIGTSVTINDTAPTGDQYNLALVEILPAAAPPPPTYAISGTVSGAIGSGVTVSLTGASTSSAITDALGNYTFGGLVSGTYTVAPSQTGYIFAPPNQPVTLTNASAPGINFTSAVAPTYSISGAVTGAVTSGVSVTLSGASNGTATTGASGNYSFSGLSNGNYTVTPSKTGYTFTPVSQPVLVNNANIPAINFTSAAIPTYTLSGTVSGASPSGVNLTLSGASSGTAVTDGSGNYSFTGLSNGTYTVTPAKSGYTFTPTNQSATITGANVAGVNFNSQAVVVPPMVTIDASVSNDQNSASTTVISPTFSTTAGNELLLAFVATDYNGSGNNTTVTSVSGGGLTWAMVVRTNAQRGDSEIWRAFAATPLSNVAVTATISQGTLSSITVMSFAGVDPSGANGASAIGATKSANAASGAPSASLVTTRNNSLVIGVGNDYDNAIARTLGPGQTLIHQVFSATGDTYWVQRQTATTPLSGTTVTISDTAPTGDRYNLSICEILPAIVVVPTYKISGTLTPAASGSGTQVTLSGASSATTAADASGNYSFTGLSNGNYTVTPAKSGFTFTPANRPVAINSADAAGIDFTAQAVPTYTISGNIAPAADAAGSTVTLTGTSTATVTPDSSGNYSFSGLANGTYTIRPSKTGFTFNPVNQFVTVNGADEPGNNFTIQAVPTYSISGSITPALNGSGATLTLSGGQTGTTSADASGNFTFTGIPNGNYAVTPSKTGYSFAPSVQSVSVNGSNTSAVNFTAQASQPSALIIDATTSANQDASSATVQTSPFSTQYPNELLLALIATDAPPSGTNTVVNSVSGGGLTWTRVIRTNAQKGDTEIWRAFAPATLTSVSVTASLSNSVASSLAVLSFAGADATGSGGSGAIGATKSASAASGAPTATLATTRANSWVLGVGNDYDNPIARTLGANQTLINQFMPGVGDTYWMQRQNAPTPVAGTNVTINDTAPTGDRYNLSIVEVLPSLTGGGGGAPPTVSMISPAPNQTVTSKTTVAANASSTSSAITGVQFRLDGANLGPQVTAPPYSMTWDTTTTTSGSHALAAIATDSSGNSTTSSSITITVDNSGSSAVVGSWSAPVTIPAVAVNLILLKNGNVLFYQDGATPTVWNYNTNVFTNIATSADLFCSGHALLADGRVLVVGGFGGSGSNIGIAKAEIFDPATNVWTAVPNMAFKRWYPTATTLSDGRILVTAGWQTTAHTNAGIPEIYDPATNLWTSLTNANNPFETYPFIFQLTDGRVIHVGGTEYPTVTDILDLTTQTWTNVDSRVIDGASATMYLPDQILKAGSSTDSQNVGPSLNTAYVLDMTQPSASWQQVPSMAYPRSFMNLTELPDGTVLATGGETDKDGGNIANAVYAAELWSPATKTWTTMASMHSPREYHGTALLLPDGRVLESGMGADFGNVPDQMTAEFYSPPYLFKGARPTITQAPTGVAYGQNFFVGTPDGASITKAVLIRTGAVTHFFDENTRYVPVSFVQTTGGLTVTAPANANMATPGYYMLFLVNSNGVPAVAPILQVHP